MTVSNDQIAARLKSEGFFMYATCNCGGIYTEKYKLEGSAWKVRVMPRKGIFFIQHHGNTLIGKKFDKFDEVFNQYLPQINGSEGA